MTGEAAYEHRFDGVDRSICVRDAAWDADVGEVSIYDLLDRLSWIKSPKNWGFYMRGAYREIPQHDFERIADAMRKAAA